jgi:hypothetical protein
LFPRFTASRTLLRHKVELTQKNYQGDGDSVFRLFYETVKEEIIVHVNQTYIVFAEVSATYDQCVSGSSLAREYGGLLDNRSLEVRLFLELLCKRANRTTIAFRSLLSNEPSDRSWKNKNAPPSRNA